MGKLKNGYLQIYTGNGKGKTTAALGLGLRAAGDLYKVYMIQFLKGGKTGELNSIKSLDPYFKMFRFESPRGFFWTLNDKEKAELKAEIDTAVDFTIEALKNNQCDILILDEIMGAINNKLISENQVLEILEAKPTNMEIIMTGRDVPKYLMEKADLVTEMKDIKHYFEKGVPAREGIEY